MMNIAKVETFPLRICLKGDTEFAASALGRKEHDPV
jgi:hypothetical protein